MWSESTRFQSISHSIRYQTMFVAFVVFVLTMLGAEVTELGPGPNGLAPAKMLHATGTLPDYEQLVVPEVGGLARNLVGRPILRYPLHPAWDRDYDGWPDGWVRERGEEFPRFPKVYVVHGDAASPPSDAANGQGPGVAAGQLAPASVVTGGQETGQDRPAGGKTGGRGSVERPPAGNQLCFEPGGGNVAIRYEAPWEPGHDYLLWLEARGEEFTGVLLAELIAQDSNGGKILSKSAGIIRLMPTPANSLAQLTELEAEVGARTNPRFGGVSVSPQFHLGSQGLNSHALPKGGNLSWDVPADRGELRVFLPAHDSSLRDRDSDARVTIRLSVWPAGRHFHRGRVSIDRLELWQIPTTSIALVAFGGVCRQPEPIVGNVLLLWGRQSPSEAFLELLDRHGRSRVKVPILLTVDSDSTEVGTARDSHQQSHALASKAGDESPPGSEKISPEAVSLSSATVLRAGGGVSETGLIGQSVRGSAPHDRITLAGDQDRSLFSAQIGATLPRAWKAEFSLSNPGPGFYWLRFACRLGPDQLQHEVYRGIVILPHIPGVDLDVGTTPYAASGRGEPAGRRFGWSLPLDSLLSVSGFGPRKAPQFTVELFRWEEESHAGEALLPLRARSSVASEEASSERLFTGLRICRPGDVGAAGWSRWLTADRLVAPEGVPNFQWLQLGNERHPVARSIGEAEAELFRLSAELPPGSRPIAVVIPVAVADGPPGTPASLVAANSAIKPDVALALGEVDPAGRPPAGGLAGGNSGGGDDRYTQAPLSPERDRVIFWEAVVGVVGTGSRSPGQTPKTAGRSVTPLGVAEAPQRLRVATIELPPHGATADSRAAALTRGVTLAVAADCHWVFLRLDESTLPGLVRRDGSPGELAQPWLISTSLLRPARLIGSLPLGQDVLAWLFRRTDRALLVLWADKPTEAAVTFPDGAALVDAWGSMLTIPASPDPVPVRVDATPIFALAPEVWPFEWQQSLELEAPELDPEPGRPQRVSIHFRNTSGELVAGRLRLHVPPGFRVIPESVSFTLQPEESFRHSVDIITPPHALAGAQRFLWHFQWEKPSLRQFAFAKDVILRWPDLGVRAWRTRGQGKSWLMVEVSNTSGQEMGLILEVFSPEKKRLALPPRVFPPGVQRVEIGLDEGLEDLPEGAVIQIRQADGPRRIRVPVN